MGTKRDGHQKRHWKTLEVVETLVMCLNQKMELQSTGKSVQSENKKVRKETKLCYDGRGQDR